MAVTKKVTWTHDEWAHKDIPTLTITVEGWSDVVRITEHLATGQCEFGDLSRRIHNSLARKLGRKRWREYVAHFTGRRAVV